MDESINAPNPANYGDKAIRAASLLPASGFPGPMAECMSLSGEINKEVNQDPGKHIKEYT
jgi:hypothetical protein